MTRTTAAICGFFVAILNSGIANAADYREMFATSSTGDEFIITNQPCNIDFHEPTNFKYQGYFVQDGVRYESCWYGDDSGIWIAVDHFHQITALDPNAFHVRQNPKQFRGEY